MGSRCTESSFGRFLTEFKNSTSKEYKCISMGGFFIVLARTSQERFLNAHFSNGISIACVFIYIYKKIISPSWLKWQPYFEKTDCVCTCVYAFVQKYPWATIILEFLCHNKKDQQFWTHNVDQSKPNFSLSLMTFSTTHKVTRKPMCGMEIRHMMQFCTDVLSIEFTTQRTF